MADTTIDREFTAERRRKQAFARVAAQAKPSGAAAFGTIAGAQAAAVDRAIPADADEPEACVEGLHWELSQLKNSIDHMRMEIAALRSEKSPPAPWEKATCELDAVVRSTEAATHTILEAAEQIDALLAALRDPLRDAAAESIQAAVERAGEQVVRIFEACNFQDITGQRITKVVSAIKFIEGRIDRMIEILGGQGALSDIELPPEDDGRRGRRAARGSAARNRSENLARRHRPLLRLIRRCAAARPQPADRPLARAAHAVCAGPAEPSGRRSPAVPSASRPPASRLLKLRLIASNRKVHGRSSPADDLCRTCISISHVRTLTSAAAPV